MLLAIALFSPRDIRPKPVAWPEAVDPASGRTATATSVVVVAVVAVVVASGNGA